MSEHRIYRSVIPGVETFGHGIDLPRHRHACGYATVVLAGTFVEASFAGRFVAQPGDVLLHAPFDCHANAALSPRGVQILRLPWSDCTVEGRFRVRDPDVLARLCENDAREAAHELRVALRPVASCPSGHWSEELANDLSQSSSVALGVWAEQRGLADETISRGFRRAFGVAPRLFRLEARARRAWVRLTHTRAPLTAIAHELEFADLAHMSRSVHALTGFAPSAWRSAADRATLMGQLRSSRAS